MTFEEFYEGNKMLSVAQFKQQLEHEVYEEERTERTEYYEQLLDELNFELQDILSTQGYIDNHNLARKATKLRQDILNIEHKLI